MEKKTKSLTGRAVRPQRFPPKKKKKNECFIREQSRGAGQNNRVALCFAKFITASPALSTRHHRPRCRRSERRRRLCMAD